MNEWWKGTPVNPYPLLAPRDDGETVNRGGET